MKIMNVVKRFHDKSKKVVFTGSLAVFAALTMALTSVGAAPATGDTDVDAALTSMEASFGTLKTAFWYLALAAIPITLAVLAFFWLRGKFKQAVSGS